MREDLAKHHVEVREETMKEKDEAFINCHSLIHQYSLSPESIAALLHDLKRKKYKKRRKSYTALWRRNYCSLLPILAHQCSIYR